VPTTEIDARRTAFVFVDLMPRIIATPTAPYTGADVLTRCLELADAARAAGALVVWVRVERPGVESQPPGSELAPGCAPRQGEHEIVKRTIGAFHRTELDAVLRARGVETVVLAGLVTNFGVESTGRAADEHGYAVVFASDAMSGFHEHAHRFAVEYVFGRIGEVRTTAELVAALS
jgi:nicotinamidase-related amidase